MKLEVNDKQLKIFRVVIGILWLLMQLFFLWNRGIETGLEAEKYIYDAHYLLQNGHFSESNMFLYSTIVLLMAFCIKAGVGFWLIVLLQMILNGISVYFVYKIIYRFSSRKIIAIIGALYFLLLFYYHQFNTFLFTESLFFSLSVIYTGVLFCISPHPKMKEFLLPLILLIILCFTRPVGIFFIPATMLFLLIRFYTPRMLIYVLTLSIVGIVAFAFIVNYAISSGGRFDFLLPYTQQMIICEVPGTDHVRIQTPGDGNSLTDLFYIITHYPKMFIELGIARLKSFFGAVRPFYSLMHNLILATYFYLLYFVIILFSRSLFKEWKAEAWYLILMISLTAFTVALSCDEWGNRFLLAVMPFILLLAFLALSNKCNSKSATASDT